MHDTAIKKNKFRTARKLLLRSFLAVVFLGILAAISLKIYLETTQASSLLSKMLTSYLHEPVSVTGLHMKGGSVRLTGVSLANPPGFLPGNLAEVDAITVTPDWWSFLRGRQSLRLVSLERPRIYLLKNATGVWNFSGLQHLFTDKKTVGRELLVKQLVVKDGVFQLDGQGANGISLHLFNLATKGSSNAEIKLAFEDAAKNHYTVTGTTRLGPKPALDLTLAAPSLSLNRLAGILLKNTHSVDENDGSLLVTAVLQDNRLRAAGKLDFSRFQVPFPQAAPTVTGAITFAADYDLNTDEVRIESLSAKADNLMVGHASGTISRLRSERRFAADINIDELNLAALMFLLPEKERQKTIVGGMLGVTDLYISGSGSRGLTSAKGSIVLKNCSFERDGQLLFRALNSTAVITMLPNGFRTKGVVSQANTRGTAMLENLQAPFDIVMSNRLKVLKAEMPSLTAKVMGLAVTGRLGYVAAAPAPYSVKLLIPKADFSSLHNLSEKFDLPIASGSGSLVFEATGRGPMDFTATASARVAALRLKLSGYRFGMKGGVVDARIIRNSGQFDVKGTADFAALSLDDRKGATRFSYRIAAGTAFVDNAVFNFDGVSGTIARIKALLPVKEFKEGTVRYPLAVEVGGGEIRKGEGSLNGFSGTVRGGYFSDQRNRWLEGTVDVSSARATWQGKKVASPAVQLLFSKSGGKGTVSGKLLDGALTGKFAFNPFALREAVEFQLGINGVRLPNLGTLLILPGTATLANGILGGTASGSYSSAAGLICDFKAAAADIAVTGNGGKSLLAGGGAKLSGSMHGSSLVINDGTLSAGEMVAVQLKGTVDNSLSPQRKGSVLFSLSKTSLNSIIDPFVNTLPRLIQEATVDGTVATEGKIVLHNGKQLLEGALLLQNVLFEVSSQQLKVTDINGSIPFSFDLSGNTLVKKQVSSSFTRENYPAILKQLRAAPVSGQSVTISSVDFGSLNLGKVQLQVSADNGVTRIDSLRTTLYEGLLLGNGFVAVKNGVSYRVDLLINGLSLKRFCATIPAIKDYITGRLDGVISLSGEGGNMEGLTGFTDLWVHAGPGEKTLVSKEFLQKLSGKNLSSIFFSSDRPYDNAEIAAVLEDGYLTFDKLDIVNTNFFGIRDLSVSIAPSQNRIAIDHLLNSIKQAAVRGKSGSGEKPPAAEEGFKWQE